MIFLVPLLVFITMYNAYVLGTVYDLSPIMKHIIIKLFEHILKIFDMARAK
jgi:hypothetical protein